MHQPPPIRLVDDITSILFITSAPDDRESTRQVSLLIDELRDRPGVSASLWYLRCSDTQLPERATRVVDSLRTWPPCAILDRLGLTGVAARIRGLRLRMWLRQIRPKVVVLDDGLGRRVIDSLRPPPRVAVRLNETPPEYLHMEGAPMESTDADMVIVPYGHRSRSDAEPPWQVEELMTAARSRAAGRMADRRAMKSVRRELRLPTEQPLVVGWGDDGWLDGPDLFVRFLWTLEHHQGVRAHGVWFGLTSDHNEVERLSVEAQRCGLGDRFHHRAEDTTAGRLCGDAVFLPYRSETDLLDLLEVACSGSFVVTFEATGTDDPLIRRIPNLDLELAAKTTAEGLEEDREERSRSARRRFEALPDAIVALG